MKWYFILLIVIGSLFLLTFLLYCIMGGFFYHVSFVRRKGDKHFAENENPKDKQNHNRIWFFSQKIEEYQMKSYDHKTLKGYMIRNEGSNKLALLIHGYRGRYYSLTYQARMFYEAGYNVFTINHRASDTSSGHWFTMGPKETRDVLDWVNLLIKENPEYQIVILGVSMGGHITMKVVGEKSLPSNVKCAIEDCGFASLEVELHSNLDVVKCPKWTGELAFFCGKGVAVLFHGHHIHSDTKDSLKNSHTPMLFIHGDADTYVPFWNLDVNYNNLTTDVYKEKKVFAGAKHAESYVLYEKEYEETIINFANKFIK